MTPYDPYDDDANRKEAQQLARQEQAERRANILNQRRPAVFAAEGALHPDAQQWARGYLAGARGSLLLIGEVGTGKTWSLWKTAETLTRAGWIGRFEIATAYEVKTATDRPIDTKAVDLWKNTDLFAIDDLGAQSVNDWDTEALTAIIDHRWQHQRPTLIASNLAPKQILGARAASRLADGATIIRFTGNDRRRAS